MFSVRAEIGRRLARQHPVDADLVIPVPESGTPAAIGYAEESGIPFGHGLVKNSYVGRTFIQPSQTIRQLGIRLKLNPLRDVIAGKRLVVVDDSIVRGNTQRALVRMLREFGAAEVHVRISSPPVKWPCFYGIDFASRAELIANGISVEEICRSIGADSLAYVELDQLIEATNVPKDNLCRACFDGIYPIALPEDDLIGKHLLEDPGRDLARPSVEPVTSTTQSAGVSIEAGDRAVELMKQWVEKARRPEVVGGIGGFAGLFDASALKSYRRPLLATSADGVGTKVAIAQAHGRPRHHRLRPRRHARRRPRRVRCRAAVPHRLHRLRHAWCPSASPTSSRASPRRAPRPAPRCSAARPQSIPGCSTPTSTTSPAPRRASSRPTRCSAPSWCATETSWWRWRRPGCTPTATRSCATSCSSRPAGRSTATFPSWAAPSAPSC